ncbi:MAG: hypothetical protein NWE82_00015 [Candidatus Bathyarchaeota archaeon]|nr:hypothetical protein [Candidatus Bathyarchaeota archaeon]
MAKERTRTKADLKNWRRRGFYSETALVKKLEKCGYAAVRVPVSNPSLHPLPDVMARCGMHVFAFEVKNARFYAYFPRKQIDKLFKFLDGFIPTGRAYKHAVIAAHLGKKWIFREIRWENWELNRLPDNDRITKRDKGNFSPEKTSLPMSAE